MAVTYPKLHGPGDVVVKPGSLMKRESADGVAWVVTLTGKRYAFSSVVLIRGVQPGVPYPQWGIPAGYYIDEITTKEILFGANSNESCLEVDLVCRTAGNMGDGIVIDSEPEVYTVDWEPSMLPLERHATRYPALTMKSFVGSTNKTVYGFIKDWIQAESTDVQSAVYQEIMALGSDDQKEKFQDFIVMYLRGVIEREIFYPVLVRTKKTNTATAANPTPGQIATPPSGFDSIKPTGTWTYRRMPTRIERIGRTGGYNIIDRWIGDPAWDTRLYGTSAEQAESYQTLG